MTKNILELELQKLTETNAEMENFIENVQPDKIDKFYMDLLHEYNNLKDAAQAVMGLLADVSNTTVSEIHKKFGIQPGNET